MSKRAPQLLLEDIVASAKKILTYTSGLAYEQFLEADYLPFVPVIRRWGVFR